MAHARITELGKKMVTKALQKEQEDVRWELTVTAFPDPSAPALQNGDPSDPSADNAFVPTLLLYLEIPVPEDRFVYGVTILPPFGLIQSNVDEAVTSGLDNLRQRRESLLTSEQA